MKLIVDCALNHHILQLPAGSALSELLAKAKLKKLHLPLQAVVCEQHGLKANPDYPIAAIAAKADGLDVSDAFWLRAEPVHLLLQRDSFSLSEPVPLMVEREHAQSIITSLNHHFAGDGLRFLIGQSGAWYLSLEKQPEIQTTLPSVAIDRNIYQYLPQGNASGLWRSYLNELQMLLFQHPVNHAREAVHAPAVNSLWFSGGGVMPLSAAPQETVDLCVADSPFYHGLSELTGQPSMPADHFLQSLVRYADKRCIRWEMLVSHVADDALFLALIKNLKSGLIKQLVVTLNRLDAYKFWPTKRAILDYL